MDGYKSDIDFDFHYIICIIHMIYTSKQEVGGGVQQGNSFVSFLHAKQPTGKSFRFVPACRQSKIGGWGVSQFVKPPTGKSFRFVRVCERAGAHAARDHLRLPRAFCGTNVSFVVFVVSARLAFSLVDPKNAQNVSRLLVFVFFYMF